jgi:predicted DNA-binding transcriptional regulator YafY
MSKISNVITLVELLSTGRKYSIRELSDILEVSPRMVRIYKEELEKAGIYIDTINGPYGGYVLNTSVRLPIRKFNSNDYKLLDKYIENEIDINKKNKLILLQDKIKGVYIGSKNENKELEQDNEKRKVRIKYYSYGTGENIRTIDPAEMFLFQDGWYCCAYCELKKDIRHFELKRIIEIELLEEKFI